MTQYNLPPQATIQQSAARPLSGEELETFGKHASSKYLCGACCSLTEAVVETVKSAGLSPEQVRRVVEFANTDAFLKEFKKEGSSTKYVTFDGGPADFSEVLKDLNDGGGGSVFDRGIADYSHAPSVVKTSAARSLEGSRGALEKTAGVELSPRKNRADEVLEAAFAIDKQAEALPYARPLQDVEDLQDKLATARDNATAEMSALETTLVGVTEDLYHEVKQASLAGTPLGHVVQAWHQVLDPGPSLVKSAFAEIGPRLVEEGVVRNWDTLGSSLEKTAGSRALANENSPIIRAFAAYGDTIVKLAHLRSAREEYIGGLDRLGGFTRQVHQHYPEHAR